MNAKERLEWLTNQIMKQIMSSTVPRFEKGGPCSKHTHPPKEAVKAWIDVKCLNRSFYHKGLDGSIHVFHNNAQ